jgi:hypothetical protein
MLGLLSQHDGNFFRRFFARARYIASPAQRRVPPPLIEALRRRARNDDRTVSGLVRLAVREMLDRDEAPEQVSEPA